jgi:phosphate transport system substrate-binding protein
MRSRSWIRTRALVAVGLFGAASGGLGGFAAALPASAAPSHQQISGTGSSWSANAVSQWVSDVSSTGLRVDFTGSGSAQGRKDFANGITDFAVTDIGYQGKDPLTGEDDTNCVPGQACRSFAYEPIVAGGTAFPYQVRVGGQLVRNLRLSGETLTKIFTYRITNWNDPQITHDNNGRKLPSLKIIPVVHSEGSGSTAQFTSYMDARYASIWRAFTGKAGFTEYYPPPQGGKGIAQNGSDGVMNFLSSNGANGAIGYDEYSYPLAKNFPVAKILNKAGYYTLPDQYNVAVALQHAKINMNKKSPDYLLQTLDQVYVAPEVQAYPLSSYSYFVIPTAKNDTRMTTAKRQTLADYLFYAVCLGQKEIGPIGYSPLPINLVQASFNQTALLHAADSKVDLTKRNVSTCQNPTFDKRHPEVNHLAKIAPNPPSCDKQGAGPCTGNGASGGAGSGGSSGGGGGGSGGGAGSGGSKNSGGTGAPTGSNQAGPSAGVGASGSAGGGTAIDPETGQAVGANGGNGSGGGDLVGQPTELQSYRQPVSTGFLAPLAVIELLAVLVGPPLLYHLVLRRRRGKV